VNAKPEARLVGSRVSGGEGGVLAAESAGGGKGLLQTSSSRGPTWHPWGYVQSKKVQTSLHWVEKLESLTK